MAMDASAARMARARTSLTRRLTGSPPLARHPLVGPEVAARESCPDGVPHAPDGVDQLGLVADLDLAPQVADVHGKVLRVRDEVIAPDAVVDRGVVEHDAGVPREELEQFELGLGEVQLPVAPPSSSGRGIELKVADGQPRRLVTVGL